MTEAREAEGPPPSAPPVSGAAVRDADGGGAQAEGERQKLVARAGVVGAGTLASRILGLFRDMALAALFDRRATDAWWVAFTIPNALRSILGEGAVTSAVVPVLTETLEREGDAGARRLFRRVRGASLLALLTVTVVGMAFARPLTELFAAGLHARPGEFERTVALTRAVFPYIFFMGTAALGMAALNVRRRFAVAAFAPGLLNVALLAACFSLPRPLAARGVDPVMALAAGSLLGGFLQVAAQWPALRRLGYAGLPSLSWEPGVGLVLRRIAPLTLGLGVYYVDLVLSRRFLSEAGVGAQSYFSWAMRLCDFPQGIFTMAISTAALPSLSSLAAHGARHEFVRTWAHGVRLALFVALPASVLLVAAGEPIVVTLFQRGEFDARAAHETARALLWQGGALWTVAVVRQTVQAFYALGDTRTPVVVSAIDLGAFIALALTLRGPMGHVGISVAVAGSSAVQMVLLLAALRLRLAGEFTPGLSRSVARTAALSVVGGVAAWAAARLTSFDAGGVGGAGGGGMARAWPGIAALVAFGGVYGLGAWGARSPELEEVIAAVRRRAGRRGRAGAGAGARAGAGEIDPRAGS
ncbi:MAG: murein biosynthesis integral membrane protein MurJ [Myxococcales bacterium]|nr:murein biosynthesis integral membrane protein MurJ [Myxococcales bacterium]